MNERRGNVVENKGLLRKTPGLGRNVVENKCTYPFKAGILLKRKGVKAHDKKKRTTPTDNLSSLLCTLLRPSEGQRHAPVCHAQTHMHYGGVA
jgi:hypothetical protein